MEYIATFRKALQDAENEREAKGSIKPDAFDRVLHTLNKWKDARHVPKRS